MIFGCPIRQYYRIITSNLPAINDVARRCTGAARKWGCRAGDCGQDMAIRYRGAAGSAQNS